MKIIDKTIPEHQGVNDCIPQYIVVHHTAGSGDFKTVKDYHTNQRGWETIGYNYFIDTDGIIYQGRPETTHGAHARGLNTKSVGIALRGDFSVKGPSEDQINALRWLITDVKTRWDIKDMGPHRKWAQTECFGKFLPDNWLQMIMDEQPACICLKDATKQQLISEFVSRF